MTHQRPDHLTRADLPDLDRPVLAAADHRVILKPQTQHTVRMSCETLKYLAGFEIPYNDRSITAATHDPALIILQTEDTGIMSRIRPQTTFRRQIPDLDRVVSTAADNFVVVKLNTINTLLVSWKFLGKIHALIPVAFQQFALLAQKLPVDHGLFRGWVAMNMKRIRSQDVRGKRRIDTCIINPLRDGLCL